MLTPMNHREIEYNTRRFWNEKNIGEKNIADIFSEWSDATQRNAALKLMSWLEKTQEEVFQEDLLLDYGADCLRLYLMFEKTPGPDDTWLDTWEECNLEGCYKFLGRFRRMILVADYANHTGRYLKLDATKIRNKVFSLQKEVMQHLSKGNTMPDRHNAIAVIMEGMKQLHKELCIGELVTSLHSHEIAMAVPHAQKEEDTESRTSETDKNTTLEEALAEMVVLLAPFSPVLAEHLWQRIINNGTSVLSRKWRKHEPAAEKILLPVQVNGKTKKVIALNADACKEEAEALAKQEISQTLEGKEYKIIYVPGKIMNFVMS